MSSGFPEPVTPTSKTDDPTSAGRKPDPYILVVEDDPAIRWTVQGVLVDEAYRVKTAENGKQALAVMEGGMPSLILLDMRMPVMDGWTFASRLHERDIHIPIVVMTAAQDSRARAAEIDAAASISKPFDLEDLLRTVEAFGVPRCPT